MLSHINIGTGTDVTIKELADRVKDVVGFKGKLIFDNTKLDGAPRKLMDISLLSSLGWCARTSLGQGLSTTYENYIFCERDYYKNV